MPNNTKAAPEVIPRPPFLWVKLMYLGSYRVFPFPKEVGCISVYRQPSPAGKSDRQVRVGKSTRRLNSKEFATITAVYGRSPHFKR